MFLYGVSGAIYCLTKANYCAGRAPYISLGSYLLGWQGYPEGLRLWHKKVAILKQGCGSTSTKWQLVVSYYDHKFNRPDVAGAVLQTPPLLNN